MLETDILCGMLKLYTLTYNLLILRTLFQQRILSSAIKQHDIIHIMAILCIFSTIKRYLIE